MNDPVGSGWRSALRALALGFIGGALAVCALKSNAQPTLCPARPTCDPYTQPDRTQCGAELKGTTGTGEWRGWWYPVDKTATTWGWCRFQWASLNRFAPKTPHDYLAIVDVVKAASEPTTGIMDAITRFSVKPAPGSVDEYDYRVLHYSACQALVASPPVPAWTSTPPNCGPAPTLPVPILEWTATGGTIFTYSASRLTGVTTRKATKGAKCDDRAVAIVGATVYRSLVGGPATEVTPCVKP